MSNHPKPQSWIRGRKRKDSIIGKQQYFPRRTRAIRVRPEGMIFMKQGFVSKLKAPDQLHYADTYLTL